MGNVIETKVKDGILRAWVEDDPNYPGISVEFIPDYTDRNVLSYPRVLMEKPTESECLRALLWEKPDDEDFTTEIVFEEPTNLEKRLEKIKNKAKTNKEKIEQQKKKEQEKFEQIKKELMSLQPRVAIILQLANACRKENIMFPSYTKDFGYGENRSRSFNFCADGINHHTGLMTRNNCSKIEYLGILNGGYNGPYDFYINENTFFFKTNFSYSISEQIFVDTYKKEFVETMEKFIQEFGLFEEAFNKWIDSLE